MNDMIVKSVDLMGDTVIAAQDSEGNIWAGVSYFCKALGMSNKQRDNQVVKVQTDKTLCKGTLKFREGVFDPANEVIAIKVDFIPLWLAKIQITKKMEQDHPELADKLLEYQLKAKDILADAFLPKQESTDDVRGQIKLLAKGTDELYQRVDAVTEDVKNVKEEMESIKNDLPILPLEADKIEKAVRKRGVEVLGGKDSNAYRDRGIRQRVYNSIYANLKYNFDGVRTYKAIRRKDADRAIQIVNEYKPPLFLADQIENANAQQRLDV